MMRALLMALLCAGSVLHGMGLAHVSARYWVKAS